MVQAHGLHIISYSLQYTDEGEVQMTIIYDCTFRTLIKA